MVVLCLLTIAHRPAIDERPSVHWLCGGQ
jgi:hypothetical protein